MRDEDIEKPSVGNDMNDPQERKNCTEVVALSEGKPRRFERLFVNIQRFVDKVAGTEKARFIIGSVFVPLLITGVAITIGAKIASDFQDWQDRRSRARDIATGMRETASSLYVNLDDLADQGSVVERSWSKKVPLEEIRAVKDSLERLQGMSVSLKDGIVAKDGRVDQATIAKEIAKCRRAVDNYSVCLAGVIRPDRTMVGQKCTDTFRQNIKAKGSCESLRLTVYSLAL